MNSRPTQEQQEPQKKTVKNCDDWVWQQSEPIAVRLVNTISDNRQSLYFCVLILLWLWDLQPQISSLPTRIQHQVKWSFKLTKRQCKTSQYLNYFTNSIIDAWNSLPTDVVTAPSINAFQNRLDKLWKHHPMKFNPDYPDACHGYIKAHISLTFKHYEKLVTCYIYILTMLTILC